MTLQDVKYYEAHVTIEPVFEERLEAFKEICASANFKVAKLLMQKKPNEAPETSKKDSFCTGHDKDGQTLMRRMEHVVKYLREAKFEVLRYKIEAVVFDSRSGDTFP
jgi:hypothetical protein